MHGYKWSINCIRTAVEEAGWEEEYDESSRSEFWFNRYTNATQWHRPTLCELEGAASVRSVFEETVLFRSSSAASNLDAPTLPSNVNTVALISPYFTILWLASSSRLTGCATVA